MNKEENLWPISPPFIRWTLSWINNHSDLHHSFFILICHFSTLLVLFAFLFRTDNQRNILITFLFLFPFWAKAEILVEKKTTTSRNIEKKKKKRQRSAHITCPTKVWTQTKDAPGVCVCTLLTLYYKYFIQIYFFPFFFKSIGRK